jgi:hypothetical protein
MRQAPVTAAAAADGHAIDRPWVDAGADRGGAAAATGRAHREWTGDAKDHPGYRSPYDATVDASWSGDAKDHPGYGPIDASPGAEEMSGYQAAGLRPRVLEAEWSAEMPSGGSSRALGG